MTGLSKVELVSIWKKLDKACEAISTLEDKSFFFDGGVTFNSVVSLKNEVEMEIEKKTRKGTKDPFKH